MVISETKLYQKLHRKVTSTRKKDYKKRHPITIVKCGKNWVTHDGFISIFVRARSANLLPLFTERDKQRLDALETIRGGGSLNQQTFDKFFTDFTLKSIFITKGVYWPKESVLDLKTGLINGRMFVFSFGES